MATRPSVFPRVFDSYFRSYATGISFDSVELINPEPFPKPKRILINVVDLESGKQSIQSSTEVPVVLAFKCWTDDHQDVVDLYVKIGTKADLIVGAYRYTNCYISSFSETEWFPNKWHYEVGFVQETA